MLVYTALVFAWSVLVPPLGRDFAALANPAEVLSGPAAWLFGWEMAAFGTWKPGYHLVNLVLLYAGMLCVYRFTRLAVKGHFWLGTLAATLLMANPVHSEAVLNLSGVNDLLPFLCAMLALLAYAEHVEKPTPAKGVLLAVLSAAAVLPFEANALLVVVMVLYEILLGGPSAKVTERLLRLSAPVAVSAAGLLWHAGSLTWQSLSPFESFAPLYLVFYPIGLLPETARALTLTPILFWVAAGCVAVLVGLLCRKARRPAILFGLVAMPATRLLQGVHHVDLVHMIGGGRLLLANALFNVALAGLFMRIMDHPKWRRPVVMWTTLLAVVLFGLQIRSVVAWYRAAAVVRDFREAAAAAPPGFGVLPDYRYYLGAPTCLSESIRFDTPFSEARPCVSVLPLHYDPAVPASLSVAGREPGLVRVAIVRPDAVDLLPWPYVLTMPEGTLSHAGFDIRNVESAADRVVLEVVGDSLPPDLIPVLSTNAPDGPLP